MTEAADATGAITIGAATEAVAAILVRCEASGVDFGTARRRGVALHHARGRAEAAPEDLRPAIDATLRVLATLGPTGWDELALVCSVVDDPALAPIRAHEAHEDFVTCVEEQGVADPLQHLALLAELEGRALLYDGTFEVSPDRPVTPFDGVLGEALRGLAGLGVKALTRRVPARPRPR